jgi:hypothetical protein
MQGQWEQTHHHLDLADAQARSGGPTKSGQTKSAPVSDALPDYPEYGDPITSSEAVSTPPRVPREHSPPRVQSAGSPGDAEKKEDREKPEDSEDPAGRTPGFWLDSEGWVGGAPDAAEGQGLFGGWGKELQRWSGVGV